VRLHSGIGYASPIDYETWTRVTELRVYKIERGFPGDRTLATHQNHLFLIPQFWLMRQK